ncbi:transmembrane protein [Mycobacterium tuberculosis]|nr:transmembrane protein [Mycobacterium tuberculosis]
MRPRRALAGLAADVVAVLVFCAVGRRSHAEGLSVTGLAATAWPFLTGTGIGWVLARGWRRPTALAPTGVIVWLCTIVVGMVLRKVSSAGWPRVSSWSRPRSPRCCCWVGEPPLR